MTEMTPQPPIRIGLLRLTDAAPVVIAAEKGLFADRGLDVRLSIEPSWANIADKLTYGYIDAAVMLPPLAIAISLGLRGIGAPLFVPMSLSMNGNSVTVSNELFHAVEAAIDQGPIAVGSRLRDYLRNRAARPRFAVVHLYSTHNLLLRYWLAACGIDPDSDVELSVVPPAEAAAALQTGQIDGFCAGAPWGAVAARADAGRTIVTSSQIWGSHPEKCFAATQNWAMANPESMKALLDALIAAAHFCDQPANADEIAHILSGDRYLALDEAVIRESLPTERSTKERAGHQSDRSVFFANAANFPWRSHAAWFVSQMERWKIFPVPLDRASAIQIYRPALFRIAAGYADISAPIADSKPEGAHDFEWMAEGMPSAIDMAPDRFCDGKIFSAE